MSSDVKNDTSSDVGDEKIRSAPSGTESKEDRKDEPSRVQLSESQLDISTAGELRALWRKQDTYVDSLESSCKILEGKLKAAAASEEKLKQQINDHLIKEKILIRRLAAKEHMLQEYANELNEMKSSQNPSSLRNCLLDPTVNLLIQKLRQENSTLRTKLEDTQNELTAWKFTPDSNTGKRLMAKCRLLYQENEDLGKEIASGRFAKLEGDLALQKGFCEEVKKSQSEMDELLQDLDEDVEGMQSSIYYLQQELRRCKDGSSGRDGGERPVSPPEPVANGHSNGDSVASDRKRTAPSPPPRPPDKRALVTPVSPLTNGTSPPR